MYARLASIIAYLFIYYFNVSLKQCTNLQSTSIRSSTMQQHPYLSISGFHSSIPLHMQLAETVVSWATAEIFIF